MENCKQKREKKKSTSSSTKRGTRPLKVVYISNPMKLKASVSDFRSVVQEFTGQNSVWPVDDPSKFLSYNQTDPNNISSTQADLSAANSSSSTGTADPSADVSAGSSDLYSQPLDQDGVFDDDDDRVVLIDHHMLNYMLHDHQDFTGFADSFKKV